MESRALKQKRQHAHILFMKAHLVQAKPAIVESFGVSSTKEMSEMQLDELIDWLEDANNYKYQETTATTRKLRSQCLRAMTYCGVNTQDFEAVNAYMMDRRICGKLLYECTDDELRSLHRKLNKIAENVAAKNEKLLKMSTTN